MKRKIASLDLIALLQELREYYPAKVEKIYQPSDEDFLFQFYSPSEGNFYLRILPGKALFLSKKRSDMGYPPHFCMFLRKYLNNTHLENIKQRDFERIIEFEFEREGGKTLIAELFSKGNLILLDKSREIIAPLSVQEWKHRTIRKGEDYEYPPSFFISPVGLSFDLFLEHIKKDQLVKQLAKLGLGGKYAEEILKRADFSKDEDLSKEDAKGVFNVLESFLERVKTGDINPTVYLQDGKPIFYAPFMFETYQDYDIKNFETMNEALEFYYKGFKDYKEKKEVKKRVEKRRDKLKSRLEKQKEKQEGLKRRIKEYKKKGDLVYQNIQTIEDIIKGLKKAKDEGYDWEEIKKRIEKSKYSQTVEEIRQHEGEVILDLENEEIKIDFTLSPNDNAQFYYDKKKELEEKLEGVDKAIRNTKGELEGSLEEVEREKRKERLKPKKKWYDKFHSFKTSKSKLVLIGKDAETNGELIDKYLEGKDLVFHAKVKGSPFSILKKGQKASEEEKKETAIATASYSRAWKEGLGSLDVYAVRPDQVSKEAPSGEYLPRGSFMIRGNKEFFTVELEMAVGVKIDKRKLKVVSAPKKAIEADHYVVLRPGTKSKNSVSKEIKNSLLQKVRKEDKGLIEQVKLEEIKRVLPAGGSRIIEAR